MSYRFRLRVDLLDGQTVDDVESKFRSFRDYCPVIFLVREIHGKVHWHAYVETDVKIETFRQRVRKLFSVSGAQYKLGLFDPKLADDHFRYLCKGENSQKGDPVNVVIDTEGRHVQQLHEAFHARRERLGDARSSGCLLDDLIEFARSRSAHDKESVVECVVAFYKQRKKMFDEFLIRRAAQTVYCHIGGVKADDDLIRRVLDRMNA